LTDENKKGEISDLFRSVRGQTLEHPTECKEKVSPFKNDVFHPHGVEVPISHNNITSDKYQSFLDKYDDLERFIDGFTPQDLMYYFREKSKEAGYKYVVSNMRRDMGIYKKLLDSFSAREIALMIEFIFFSEQDYLDKSKTQPTVLSSSYVNTIYSDATAWAKDEYVPSATKRKSCKKVREWKNTSPERESAKIGEW
jgi:hypothetical protein